MLLCFTLPAGSFPSVRYGADATKCRAKGEAMATIEECRAAVGRLADHLARDAHTRGRLDLNRRLSVEITDLGTGFHGHLSGGRLIKIADGPDPDAKIRLRAASDDLIDLIDGRVSFAHAWASGRVSVRASVFDLMKLRSLL